MGARLARKLVGAAARRGALQQEQQAGNMAHCTGNVARCVSSALETIINTVCARVCRVSAGLLRTDLVAHAQDVAGSSRTRYKVKHQQYLRGK